MLSKPGHSFAHSRTAAESATNKPASPMVGSNPVQGDLAYLNNCTIGVSISIQGQPRLFSGLAVYEFDPELGGLLRIQVAESNDNFEFVLHESRWSGHLQDGSAFGCDYAVHLC